MLVSGRGTNLAAVLAAKSRGELPHAEIACVISNVAGAPALAIAEAAGVPRRVIPHQQFATREAFDEALCAVLLEAKADGVLLAGFMRLLTPRFIETFRHRIINVHPSLLPAFPGAHAVRDALAYGAKVTGVTVHLVDEGTDTGPVIMQQSVPIEEDDTEERLHARMQRVEHVLVPRALELLCAGRLSIDGRKVRIASPDGGTEGS